MRQIYMKDFIENCYLALSGESVRHGRFLKFNSDERWWALTYEPAKDPGGEIIGISYNAVDITQRVLKEQKVIQQNKELKNIAYIQSHELRRPLSSILGFMH